MATGPIESDRVRRWRGEMIRATLFTLLFLKAEPSHAAQASFALADHAGLYVASDPLLGPARGLPDALYREPAAAGVYLRLVWARIEPESGRFDFSSLDREVARAVAAGRRLSISVMAGGRSPEWLARQGARVLRFRVGRGGVNRACVPIAVPLPWDAAYQRAYAAMMARVAARLRATPGAWAQLRVVKLTGIGRITEELRVPISVGADECGGDPNAQWRVVGYTPDRVVAAWSVLADTVATAFPGKLLGQDIIERNDFPAATGGGDDPEVKRRIIARGIARYPGRFLVQWNGLTASGPIAPTPIEARARGALLGWQTNAFRGLDGAGCNAKRRVKAMACDAQGYAAILERGVRTGAAYIEIWPDDALRFPKVVSGADAAIRRARW